MIHDANMPNEQMMRGSCSSVCFHYDRERLSFCSVIPTKLVEKEVCEVECLEVVLNTLLIRCCCHTLVFFPSNKCLVVIASHAVLAIIANNKG